MMTASMKPHLFGLAAIVATVLATTTPVAAQRGRQAPLPESGPSAGAEEGIAPAEIQRMFDAYALLQAQTQLDITDDQYTRFLARFKALQDVRRKAVAEHTRL